MARIFTNITRLTELEAVNASLAAIGEAPVLQAEIENPTLADVTLAIDFIQDTLREVLSQRWRFNSEFGFEIAPSSTFAWTGSDGTTATLNIFLVPTDLASFELTATPEQADLDIAATPPRDFAAAEGTLVFYDLEKNRDGLDENDFEKLFIDPIFFRDFEDCPEVLRRYVTIKSSRRFQARVMGSRTLDVLSQQDEAIALRNLRRDQALTEDLNIFNNSDTLRHLGVPFRHIFRGSVFEDRDAPGFGV